MSKEKVIDCEECDGKILISSEDKKGKYRCFRCGTPVELKMVQGVLTPIFTDVCQR